MCYVFHLLYLLLLQTGISITGADVGMNLGMFTMGMLIPWINSIVSDRTIIFVLLLNHAIDSVVV